MIRTSLAITVLLLSACASFDKNNILPGQRVDGPGFSFEVPTQKPWFAVIYGNSNRIRLSQLNDQDSYILQVTMNRGPRMGMYQSAQAHLQAVKRHTLSTLHSLGYQVINHNEETDARFGALCVRYEMLGEDARGRGQKGPAKVERIGLSCPHQDMHNVIVSYELSRRSDSNAPDVDLEAYADQVFASVKYE